MKRLGRRAGNQRGLALLIAILALVVVGALVTGVFTAAMLENRMSQNSRQMQQAFAAAEQGLAATLANWNSGTYNLLAVLDSAPAARNNAAGSGSYSGTVRRLNTELFLVQITGVSAAGRARRRVGAFVRLRPLIFDVKGAVTTRGPTSVTGSATISGFDQVPTYWNDPALCKAAGPAQAGIRFPPGTPITTSGGCRNASCVSGNPALNPDATVTNDTFFKYGDLDWAALTAMATKPLTRSNLQGLRPSLNTDGSCNTADQYNWGDPENPYRACGGYFPIIYAPGDLSVSTGVGQGILLVEGHLTFAGGFSFYGIVIVRSDFKTAGNGNKIFGGLLAADVNLGDVNQIVGDVVGNYSACAVQRAQLNASVGTQFRSRGWFQAY